MTENGEAKAITIDNVCGGAMVDAFEVSLRKCLANIMDPNTDARSKREVRLKLTLHPKDDRVTVNCTFDCDEKLAGMRRRRREHKEEIAKLTRALEAAGIRV